jgi:hypothetical protein
LCQNCAKTYRFGVLGLLFERKQIPLVPNRPKDADGKDWAADEHR